MDPETARKRKERQKMNRQRALKLHEVFSSNPEAQNILRNVDINKKTEEGDQSLPINQEIANNSSQTPNSEIIEDQNINNKVIKDMKGNQEIKETKENQEIIESDKFEQNKHMIANDRNEQKKNFENVENKETKNKMSSHQTNYNLEQNIKNVSSLSSHCIQENKKVDSQNVPDLIPTETPKKFTNLFSIRMVPFLISPIFSYFSIPFGFLILILMDIVLFFMFGNFEKKIISKIKVIYEYIQEFSLRVTCMQCIIVVFHIIFQSFSMNSSINEL